MIRTLILYPDREIISKCGLDAYFFLRYLKTLLVIFVPICVIVLPILVPLNYVGGRGHKLDITDEERQKLGNSKPTGLDTLSWGNVSPENTGRYTAHLVLAILVIIWVCTVFFFELRVYIKVRQDYLTTAEHRLRASATTVLVSAIPKKWLSEEALLGLFDVFPGGVRNVWINRDLTQLLDKISLRDKIHKKLESAETDLIKAAKKAQLKKQKSEENSRRRKLNLKSLTKKERYERDAKRDAEAKDLANSGEGAGAGDQNEVPHTVDAGVRESRLEEAEGMQASYQKDQQTDHHGNPVFTVGHGLTQVVSKTGRGVNNALATNNGFMSLGVSQSRQSHDGADRRRLAHEPDSSPVLADAADGARTGSPGGSMLTSSSTRAIQKPVSDDPAGNTVRQLENMNDMYLQESPKFWQFWKPPPGGYTSPVPQGAEAEEYMTKESENSQSMWTAFKHSLPFMGPELEPVEYTDAYDAEYKMDMETDAEWAKYLKKKDRPTHHLPLFGQNWLFGMYWVTKKVDTIYWCRQELARLNLEIEEDQKYPERFPLMSSAFIQFNHQIAAHMACQSIVHHLPKQMAPRMNEISPHDVIWGNMAVSWWQQWVRTFAVVTIAVAMTVLWAIPVAWTAAVSQADSLIRTNDWLSALAKNKALGNLVKAIAGVLPAALLGLLLILVPLIFSWLASLKGSKTGAQKAEFVQRYYFVFLFVQVFLVVSIASFFAKSLGELIDSFKALQTVGDVLNLLAKNLPSAAIYFFSYMILQALSTSSGTLLQVGTLFMWFIMAPMFDSTARNKWTRNTSLNQINWGTFFPVYTNFACIGIIYCIIAPLISIFAVITFSLLWLAQRYAMLYVNRFEMDTGGVLYPRAINQTFTGLYFMELCMAGLFFIVVGPDGSTHTCTPHGVIMIVVFVLTVLYQFLLNHSFSPLFRYLPVTFEDEAVIRDEAFQRAQDARFGLTQDDDDTDDETIPEKFHDLANRDKNIEMQRLEPETGTGGSQLRNPMKQVGTWAKVGGRQVGTWAKGGGNQLRRLKMVGDNSQAAQYRRQQRQKDIEAQRAIGDALYGGVHDDIEDLTPEERDALTRHAFQHSALRARRPTVWIPRDDLGISEDEVRRTQTFSQYIWISNEGTALDSKMRVVYGRNPPDFSEVDIINL